MLKARQELEDNRDLTPEQEEIFFQKWLKDFLDLIPKGGKVLLKNGTLTIAIEGIGRIYSLRAWAENVPNFLGIGTEIAYLDTISDFEEKMQSLYEVKEFTKFVEDNNTKIMFQEPK